MSDIRQTEYEEVFEKNTGEMYSMPDPHEPRLLCILLLDTSDSMNNGGAIADLNEGVNRFKVQVCKDETSKRRVDVAIIQFNSTVEIVQDFSPVSQMQNVNLSAHGMTAMGKAINTAIDKIKERVNMYALMGTPSFKPWIFMVTDGLPTDSIDRAIERIKEEEAKGTHGKLKFIALGINNYDKDTLFRLTHRVMEMRDTNFTKIFDWVAESMVIISNSEVQKEGLPGKLPDNTRKADPDREIDEDWWD